MFGEEEEEEEEDDDDDGDISVSLTVIWSLSQVEVHTPKNLRRAVLFRICAHFGEVTRCGSALLGRVGTWHRRWW